jgi:ABC-2 type transport system permease protein
MKIKLPKIKINSADIKERWLGSFHGKNFRMGGYSLLAGFLVIAAAALLVAGAKKLPTNWTKLDLTANNLYSISEETKKLVSGIEAPVTIYHIVQSGQEDETITNLLEKYEALNSKITVESKDPTLYPDFASKYTDEEVGDNSLVVVCGEKSKYVSYSDIYLSSMDYSTYSYTYDFNGESAVTGALSFVTSDDHPLVYLLTNHGEKLSSEMESSIEGANMVSADLDLLAQAEVPAEADTVLIASPTKDISAEEKAKLDSYLASGGKLICVTDDTDENLTNLSSLMNNYGLQPVDGIIVEGDSSMTLSGYPYYLLPTIESSEITASLLDQGYPVLAPMAHGITTTEKTPEGVTVTPLLTTSDAAYSKADGVNMKTLEKEENDPAGPFYTGVSAEKTTDDSASKVVWFSSSSMFSTETNQMVGGSNLQLFADSLGWLMDMDTSAAAISAKSLSSGNLIVSEQAAALWGALLIGVIPVCFIARGIIVVHRRKKRI